MNNQMKNLSDEISLAALIGIDPVHEPQYLWIARRALESKLDTKEWKEFTGEDGRLMYYNTKLKVSIPQKYPTPFAENTYCASHDFPVFWDISKA